MKVSRIEGKDEYVVRLSHREAQHIIDDDDDTIGELGEALETTLDDEPEETLGDPED